jgi:hypothetical protein
MVWLQAIGYWFERFITLPLDTLRNLGYEGGRKGEGLKRWQTDFLINTYAIQNP